jgi:hypothetical protein
MKVNVKTKAYGNVCVHPHGVGVLTYLCVCLHVHTCSPLTTSEH